MFSLIITIMSIALVAALGLATMYFGGDAFNGGQSDAAAAKYINEGSQVAGAIQIYQAENFGAMPADLQVDLVDKNYLKDLPEDTGNWSVAESAIIKSVDSLSKCESVNKKAGWINPNFGTDPNVLTQHEPVACGDASLENIQYFCCVSAG